MANFGIYLQIINNSSYAIGISYDAIDGKSASNTGTVFQNTRTSVMHAADSFGPHGAEGVFTLTLQGNFNEDKSNVIKIHADCPFSGKNKFRVEQSSQFVTVDNLLFSTDEDDFKDNKISSNGESKLPTSGHPLAIQLTITDKLIPGQIEVMTYNTHLFEGSPADNIGSHFHDEPVTYKDDERATDIARKIIERGSHIVCLEEVWSNDMRKKVVDALKDSYPYFYIVPDKGTDLGLLGYVPNPLILIGGPLGLIGGSLGLIAAVFTDTLTLNALIDKVKNTSGLLLVSKYPLSNFAFTMYTDLPGDDRFAKKGICTCDVKIPVDHFTIHTVKLGFTHAPTNIAAAQHCIAQAAELTMHDHATDRFLVGDFNLHQQISGEYQELNDTMNRYGARDVVEMFIPDINQSYTDSGDNALTKKFHGSNPGHKDRIDYIYFARGDSDHRLEPSGAEVIHDWNFENETMPLSDHYPVVGKFSVLR